MCQKMFSERGSHRLSMFGDLVHFISLFEINILGAPLGFNLHEGRKHTCLALHYLPRT